MEIYVKIRKPPQSAGGAKNVKNMKDTDWFSCYIIYEEIPAVHNLHIIYLHYIKGSFMCQM